MAVSQSDVFPPSEHTHRGHVPPGSLTALYMRSLESNCYFKKKKASPDIEFLKLVLVDAGTTGSSVIAKISFSIVGVYYHCTYVFCTEVEIHSTDVSSQLVYVTHPYFLAGLNMKVS